MAALGYIGRNPDSDSTVVPKTYADSQQVALGLTTSVVNTLIASSATGLTSKSYVDSGDAGVAQKTAVTAADNNYVPLTALGAANGIAQLDGSGNVITSQIPSSGVVTDRIMTCYSCNQSSSGLPAFGGTASSVTNATGTVLLNNTSSHTVSTTNVREFKVATITIPDPGFPYRALPFAWIQGSAASGTNPGTRLSGNGNYGLIVAMPPSGVSDQIYGLGLCTGSYFTDTYLLTPYAATSQTNISVPPITGSLTLDLYVAMWSGTTYTFFGANLNYYVMVVPGI